ncbi:MAG: secretin N-terminal domain-containing protein, partial [Candidatus Omnitrophota bacterium]|nr:secretin N-terminal domain-containing protein [Candidatus Omnitrophota bacterium]
NLSFDDAFNIILLSQDLAADRRGDIINVMTSLEYEKLYGKKYTDKRRVKIVKLEYSKPSIVFNAISQLKSDVGKIVADESSGTIFLIDVPDRLKLMQDIIADLDQPLSTAVFDLKYAKPADIKGHLSGAITPGLGEVLVDEKAQKVVVSDLPDKIAKIRKMIKAFDTAPLQVFIEAEIVEVTLNDKFERGIDWRAMASQKQWLKWLKMGTVDLSGFFPSGLTSPMQQVSVGTLADTNYTALFNFLQTYGNTKVLSRPRLAVVDNQEAKIMVGKRDAYVSQTLSQAQTTTVTSESVQFVDVGVKLNVVPSISSDGFIVMKIKPEVSTVESILTTYLKSQIPIIATSEAETVVKVKDGTMIMIAGLMREENVDDLTGWPYVSKIKGVGALFSKRSTQRKNTELIIFITPHIITGEAPVDDHTMEDLYPADVLPRPLKEDLIDKKIEEIEAKKDQPLKRSPAGKAAQTAVTVKDKDTDVAVKSKGLKKY